MGDHPCVFTEIGIPFDMDNKHAYKTGNYSSQVSAMDANHFALEGSGVNGYAVWVYMATVSIAKATSGFTETRTNSAQNNHQWGDLWNGEDLSIVSLDDDLLPFSPDSNHYPGVPKSKASSTVSVDKTSPAFSQSLSSTQDPVSPSTLKKSLSTPSISSQACKTPADLSHASGFRAAEAYVRPSPIVTIGNITSYGFDLRNATFTLGLDCQHSATKDVATEIFLPEFHFPREGSEVTVSGGKWTISVDDVNGGLIQRLRWWHGEGAQRITVKGVTRRLGTFFGQDEEEPGYLDQCGQSKCGVM